MAALKADVLGGTAAKSATLGAAVFGAELKRHIVHEVVRSGSAPPSGTSRPASLPAVSSR